jgi:hypothetical protein
MKNIAKKLYSLVKQADVNDNKLAITHILLRNGWENVNGRVFKKVKFPGKTTPDVINLDNKLPNFLMVKNVGGKILSKIDIPATMDNIQLLQKAKDLVNFRT